MLDAFMQNLHRFSYILTPKIQFLPPKVIVAFRNSVKLCLFPFLFTFNIFDFTTAGDWDCAAAVERLPALHYSVDFIFLSFGIMGVIVKL